MFGDVLNHSCKRELLKPIELKGKQFFTVQNIADAFSVSYITANKWQKRGLLGKPRPWKRTYLLVPRESILDDKGNVVFIRPSLKYKFMNGLLD